MESNQPRKERLVRALSPNDVILGRGQHLKNEGNTRFRTLVRSRAEQYHACESKTAKDTVARQIVLVVENMGGRFLSKLNEDKESSSDWSCLVASTVAPVWVLADEKTVLIKVKQTFRDYSVIQRKAAATAVIEASMTASNTDGHLGSNRPEYSAGYLLQHGPSAATFGGRALLQPSQSFHFSSMGHPNLQMSSGWTPLNTEEQQRQELLRTLLLQQLGMSGPSPPTTFGQFSAPSLPPPLSQPYVGSNGIAPTRLVTQSLSSWSPPPAYNQTLPPSTVYGFNSFTDQASTLSRDLHHPGVTAPMDGHRQSSNIDQSNQAAPLPE